MFYSIWVGIFLFICMITDVKEMIVYSRFCIFNFATAILIHFIIKDISFWQIMSAIVMGIVLLWISIRTKEALGKGDVLSMLTVGGIAGVSFLFHTIIWAFSMCAMFSTVALLLKRMKPKDAIPFVPFLFVGGILTTVI